MAARDSLIEHLLRRIGFGAGPGDVEQYADTRLRHRARPPDQLRVDLRRCRRADRQARLRRADRHRPRSSPASNIAPRAAALAVPDGAHPASAPGEDGALLAQPLRDRLQQGLGRHQRARRHARDGGEAVGGRRPACTGSSSCSASTRSATSAICCVAVAQGPGDAGLARRPDQRARRSRRRTSRAS